MRPFLRSLLAFLALTAAPLVAQVTEPTADLGVTIDVAPHPALGITSRYVARVRNRGQAVAEDVVIHWTYSGDGAVPPGCIPVGKEFDCHAGAIFPDTDRVLFVDVTPRAPGSVATATVTVSTATKETHLDDNVASRSDTVVDAGRLSTNLAPLGRRDPQGNVTLHYTTTNANDAQANGVRVQFSLPAGTQLISTDGADCQLAPDRTFGFCTMASLAGKSSRSFDLVVRLPFEAGRAGQSITTSWNNEYIRSDYADVTLFHYLDVTSSADAGPGTLRDALARSEHECGPPCLISFAIPDALPTRIEPLTPLPAIDVTELIIDGTTQPQYAGVPKIELYGAERIFHGLVVHRGKVTIRGLAIRSFAGNGIDVDGPVQVIIDRNDIGANGLRAISLGADYCIDVCVSEITNNVLSGNRRSGIFSYASALTITGNRIGVARDGTPLPNGASGIYIGGGFGIRIDDNVIANNRDFGIGIEYNAQGVIVGPNSITNSGILGIDVGCDGPSANGTPLPALAGTRAPKPELLTAAYDAATNETVITGRGLGSSNAPRTTYDVHFFANGAGTARPEAETFIGTAQVAASPSGEFTVRLAGDFRGKIITSYENRTRNFFGEFFQHDTSEISDPLVVP